MAKRADTPRVSCWEKNVKQQAVPHSSFTSSPHCPRPSPSPGLWASALLETVKWLPEVLSVSKPRQVWQPWYEGKENGKGNDTVKKSHFTPPLMEANRLAGIDTHWSSCDPPWKWLIYFFSFYSEVRVGWIRPRSLWNASLPHTSPNFLQTNPSRGTGRVLRVPLSLLLRLSVWASC